MREAGDELIVEAVGHHRRVADDAPSTITYIWFITVRGGRVSHFRDYYLSRSLAGQVVCRYAADRDARGAPG